MCNDRQPDLMHDCRKRRFTDETFGVGTVNNDRLEYVIVCCLGYRNMAATAAFVVLKVRLKLILY